ncbi:NF-kappa-B inhibitor alpha-like [Mercenaria mercenaria]|uniref:NF-kappa-B inhibitor alpha-like n=1 Tax=Mercenaria mercenaria TaxID=6596 RepID=UPI00234F7885|nr:NF-kappa-B inhibitor alpha-like [Mercenaria mercenaria]
MADKRNNMSEDTDLECDFVDSVQTHKKEGLTDVMPKYTKTSEYGEGRVDSGMISMGDSLEHSSVKQADKSPVQCSEAYEIEEKFNGLRVNEDDEGVSMTSLRSYDSENSQVSLPEPQEIEVDLNAVDEDGDTIVHVAIVSLMNESALALIDLALDGNCLNIQNYLHQSPLHLAVLTGQVDIVQTLVTKGVDVTLRDQQGNTPLHIACRRGDRDSVACLVQSFGDNATARKKYFSIRNCEGLTCVHVASQYKEFIILGHLFAKGADVNIGDAKSGRTMLHYAAENKDIETVTLLLTHPKIDVDCKTFKGETPLVLAFWRNYQDIVKKLKAKGACFNYDLFEESDDENIS